MKSPRKRHPGAPKGNRNAAQRGTGLRGAFYLNMAHLDVLDAYLVSQGIAITNPNRLQAARGLLYAALRAERDRQDEPPIII